VTRERTRDTKAQDCSGNSRRAEYGLRTGETERNWPWAEAGGHYDWMDRHLPFAQDVSASEI
jgi:hypothetical protein